jgi:hypothetical protein
VGRRRRLIIGVLILFCATVLGVKCGGNDRLSKAEFQQQANAICAKYQKRIDAVGQPASIEEIADWVDKVIPLVEQEIDEMDDLNPPEEDQEAFDQMIAKAEETRDAGEELGDAAERNDQAAVQAALKEGQASGDEADRLAGELDLDDCQD